MRKAASVLFFVLTVTALPARAVMDCEQVIENVTVTVLYGYYTITDPATNTTTRIYVYLGTDTRVYYGLRCDDEIDVPPSGGSRTLVRPSVQILNVNTTDPSHPILSAAVQNGDWEYPITDINFFYCGTPMSAAAYHGDGNYQFSLPPIVEVGDGEWELQVEACNGYGSCGTDYAYLHKYTQPAVEATEEINAYYPQGDDGWIFQSYTHRFAQVYSTTAFTTTELGGNSRVHLKENAVGLHFAPATPEPTFDASVTSSGALYDVTRGTGSCSNTCAEKCVYRCGWLGNFGLYPSVSDEITGIYNPNVPTWMSYAGGSLSLPIP